MTFDDIVKMMITKKYIITIILIFSIPSMAKNCPVDDVKLSQIKTYITCTSSPALGACGGLGAAVAGRQIGRSMANKIASDFTKNKDKFVQKLASDLHDESRAGRRITNSFDAEKYSKKLEESLSEAKTERLKAAFGEKDWRKVNEELPQKRREMMIFKMENLMEDIDTLKDRDDINQSTLNKIDADKIKALNKKIDTLRAKQIALGDALKNKERLIKKTIYEPSLKEIDGKSYDIANLDYDELPEKFKAENREAAKVIADEIEKTLNSGKPLNSEFIDETSKKVNFKWLSNSKDHTNNKYLVKQGIAKFNEMAGDGNNNIIQKHKKKLAALITKHGTKNVAKKAGRIGAMALFTPPLALEAALMAGLHAPKTGCSTLDEAVASEYGLIDSDCKLESPNVNNRVLNFLELDDKKQQSMLNQNKLICDYFTNFHKKVIENYEIKSVSCQGNRAIVDLNNNTIAPGSDRPAGKVQQVFHFNRDKRDCPSRISYNFGQGKPITNEHYDDSCNLYKVNETLKGRGRTPVLPEQISSARQTNRLFAMEVIQCCKSNEQHSCLKHLNKDKSDTSPSRSDKKGGVR